ncbi:MAG: prepilin-type N-terminal cleavage/methylation domain-containing protein [Nitrospinae bacterium]|nr:prepilin-type N-terminal cleavage/methylation domain-containing protein [Nitrospinota bacterium]MBL7021231.1 prepilin-type N-terminal cleavage/methylation domain-containing protein [Nitrospinaceae bacterium]
MRRHLENSKGFTLIEIISVILILGIIAAVAVPNFDRSGIAVANWAATIKSDIRYAQELAMSRNPASASPVTISFSPGGSYSIVDPSGVFTDVLRQLDGTDTSIVNNISISFNRFGEATQFGTVQISSGGITQNIIVEQYTGRVTIS